LLEDPREQVSGHGGVGRVDDLGYRLAGREVIVCAAELARILFWLALALSGAGAEFLILGKLAQDLHVHAGRALTQHIQAPGRDLRDAAGGAVK